MQFHGLLLLSLINIQRSSAVKFGIQSWGSEGDNRPLLALAAGLSAAGHEVDLVISSIEGQNYSDHAERIGIRLRQTRSLNYSTEELQNMAKQVIAQRNSLSQFRSVLDHLFNPLIEDIFRESKRLSAISDAVIGHFAVYPLSIAAESARIPHITVTTTPSVVPSASLRHPGIPWMGKKVNSLIWKAGSMLISRIITDDVNRMRKSEGLAFKKNTFSSMIESRLLNLVQASPQLVDRAPDWGSHNRLSGNLTLPCESMDQSLPEKVEKFLREGPPPLFVSFGSMMVFEPCNSKTIQLTAAAAVDTGFRAIIQYDGLIAPHILPGHDILLVGKMPHELIVPRCCGIVHHGGAGTSHTAVRSGVPSIVVMFAVDQFYWGNLLTEKGVAAAAIKRRKLTRRKLADAMLKLKSNPLFKMNSARIGSRLKTEDGVSRAVDIIEEIIQKHDV
ncbi:MAG: glycosyltransferase [Candidatus Fermentibacteria bacterium]